VSLASFNAASAADAEAAMLSCCGSRAFASVMAAGRPYASAEVLESAITTAFASLSWHDILEAMAEHPRIGDRVTGPPAAEQSGVTDAARAALEAGNLAYEERFGHVFLICATGLSGEQIITALRERLSHHPRAERAVAAGELLKITVLRARQLASS
jgi:2-oxo-4-hydroxy-4-carboxy-5-ureidoimidazoline decarboxylase